jgi:hypothetical protein
MYVGVFFQEAKHAQSAWCHKKAKEMSGARTEYVVPQQDRTGRVTQHWTRVGFVGPRRQAAAVSPCRPPGPAAHIRRYAGDDGGYDRAFETERRLCLDLQTFGAKEQYTSKEVKS